MAKPVARAAMTSLWSPKMESAWVASVRAATWNTVAVSSPAILNMLGIISSRPWEAVKVVASDAGLQRAMQRAGGAAFALHLDHGGYGAPDVGLPLGGPLVRPFAHGRRWRNGIDGDDFVDLVGDVSRGFVAVDGDLRSGDAGWTGQNFPLFWIADG